MSERRLKLLSISDRDLLYMFRLRGSGWPDFIQIVELEDVPEGATLVGLRHDPEPSRFSFVLAHPSFDPVPEGQTPPHLPPQRYHVVSLAVDGHESSLSDHLEQENSRLRGLLGDRVLDCDLAQEAVRWERERLLKSHEALNDLLALWVSENDYEWNAVDAALAALASNKDVLPDAPVTASFADRVRALRGVTQSLASGPAQETARSPSPPP